MPGIGDSSVWLRDPFGLIASVQLGQVGYQMVQYENLRSEIFEHLIAILNEFSLKLFQNPKGYDILALNISKTV